MSNEKSSSKSKKKSEKKPSIKKIFSVYPIIDEDFQYLSMEVMRFENGGNTLYNLFLRHLMDNGQGTEAGYIVRTGIYGQELIEITEKVRQFLGTGLFSNQKLLDEGVVYDQNYKQVETFSWGFYLRTKEEGEPLQ